MTAQKPIKQRIIDDIREQITSGALRPGDKLPSIAELRKQYGASDTPIKSALEILDALGLVDRHQGRGVFVAEPTGDPPISGG